MNIFDSAVCNSREFSFCVLRFSNYSHVVNNESVSNVTYYMVAMFSFRFEDCFGFECLDCHLYSTYQLYRRSGVDSSSFLLYIHIY